MSIASRQPRIYEINTWVWLAELGEPSSLAVDLGSVPSAEWDAIARYGFDAVWLMGVWERSPAGVAIANRNGNLLADFHRALPDFRPEDNVGSAYCVRRYVVDAHLGGPEGLAIARRELAKRGMGLLLDFVPNHVAPDAPWLVEHPEHFIEGNADDLRDDPGSYIQVGEKVFACGRDPYFPAWPDVVQVNAFSTGLRQAVLATVLDIARQCDGVRCDMAMLPINTIFERTWGGRAGPMPATEYWSVLIPAVKEKYPEFVFIAEAYWDLEWELQRLGFDFCYDKRLYDRLEHGETEGVRLHLCAELSYQQKLLRFIENHDEPRASSVFAAARARAAAIVMATIPGAKLFHEGQFEGRKTRVPVFLGRRPEEPVDEECQSFYERLLGAIRDPAFRDGVWTMGDCSGWPDNRSCEKLASWCWIKGDERRLVVVNLCESEVQARVRVPWGDLQGKTWRLEDALSDAGFNREGGEMQDEGLYVELPPWGGQIFSLRTVESGLS